MEKELEEIKQHWNYVVVSHYFSKVHMGQDWKTWKVLEFYNHGIFQGWKVLEKGHWSWKVLEIC